MYTSSWLLALGSCSILPTLHCPIAHHLVPLGGVDLDVRVVHEAVNADAGAEETGKGEAHLKGVGRGIRQPMFLRVGASHGGSLVSINKNIWEERLRLRLHTVERGSRSMALVFSIEMCCEL